MFPDPALPSGLRPVTGHILTGGVPGDCYLRGLTPEEEHRPWPLTLTGP